jgi:hypothetical protein
MNQKEIITAPKADAIIPSGVVDSSFACGALYFILMERRKLTLEEKKEKALYDKQYYIDKREKRINYSNNYYQNNKEKYKLSAKLYRLKNKDKLNEYQRSHAKRNRDKYKKMQRKWVLNLKYNLSLEQYNEILKNQNNKCAICNKDRNDFNIDFAVDHDHKTGNIRGLLCGRCNMGIGFFNDDIKILENAINYLRISRFNFEV